MNNLKKLRTEKCINIRELAALTGISYSVLSYLENEKRPFTQEHLEILCKYFDVSMDYMLGRTELKHPTKENATELDIALYNQIGELTEGQKADVLKAVEIIKGLSSKENETK